MIRSASSPSLSLPHKLDSEKCSLQRSCLSMSVTSNIPQATTVSVHPAPSLFRTFSGKLHSPDVKLNLECECDTSCTPRMRRARSEASLQTFFHHNVSSTSRRLSVESRYSVSFGGMSHDPEGEFSPCNKGRPSRTHSHTTRLPFSSSELCKVSKEVPSPLTSPAENSFRNDGLHFLSGGSLTTLSTGFSSPHSIPRGEISRDISDSSSSLFIDTYSKSRDETICNTAATPTLGNNTVYAFQSSDYNRYGIDFDNSRRDTYRNSYSVVEDRNVNYEDLLHNANYGGDHSGGGGGKCKIKTGGAPGNMDSNSTDAYYQRALTLNPAHPLLLRNYARFLYEVLGDNARAEEFYERAILANPGDGELLAQYAKLVWDSYRDQERAASYFDQAIQSSPEDCYVLAAYASFLWNSESAEESSDKDDGENMLANSSSCPFPSEALDSRIGPLQC